MTSASTSSSTVAPMMTFMVLTETLPAILDDLRRFAGKAEQFDDITMLGFTYYGFSDGRNQK